MSFMYFHYLLHLYLLIYYINIYFLECVVTFHNALSLIEILNKLIIMGYNNICLKVLILHLTRGSDKQLYLIKCWL